MKRKWTAWSRPEYGNISRTKWQRSKSPGQMMWHLAEEGVFDSWRGRRRALLFELACCRRAWSFLEHDLVRPMVDAIEFSVENNVKWKRVERIREHLEAALERQLPQEYLLHECDMVRELEATPATLLINHLRRFVLSINNHELADFDAHYLRAALGLGGDRFADELAAQCAIVRDIFADPFRPVAFSPAWRTETVVLIARGMYESRDFSGMPVLADALQEAGCENEEILNHCRDAKATHVRGCWVVDHVLDK